uniref:FACT complex subunit n=1 Tax=Chlamydomonas leiostraca TaxID=1034604 RepID=A0A7S0S408_9CHLO
MAEGAVSIDAATFGRRLKQLYDHWKANTGSLWGGCNAIAVAVGASSEDLRYLKSLALHLWLFGYELPDTILVFTPTELHVVASQKKAEVLQPLAGTAEGLGVKMVMHVKPKAEDGSTQFKELITTIQTAEDVKDPQVGTLPKDKHSGKFVEVYNTVIAESGLATVDVASGFADLLAVKDPAEIMNHKKAAMLAARVVKDFVLAKIETIIDEGKSVKHSKLTEQTEQVILDPAKIGVKLKAENCDIAYPPIFQSGGKYDLKVSAVSDDAPLHDGVIVVSVGTRYSFYCANLSRTFLINPTKKQEQEYTALLAAQEAVIASLADGAPLAAASDAAIKALKDANMAHLADKLSRSFGHGMGIEFRESGSSLSQKAEAAARPLRAGQVFNVCLSLTGLENPEAKDAKGKVYALQVADTVVVGEGGKAPEVATLSCFKTWDKVSYTLNDDDDAKEEGDLKLEDLTNGLPSRKALRSDDPNHKSAEALRKERQEELVKAKNEETLRRLTARKDGEGGEGGTTGRKVSEVVAYRSVGDIPVARDLTIQVDPKAESILLPVYGVLVPFHITTVKNVAHSQDGDHAHIRVTFNFGGAYEPYQKHAPNVVFLKELSFRSGDLRHAAKVVQDIKVLRSTVALKDKERAERATLVAQERLQQGKRVYKLPDLWMRPGPAGKGRKVPGTLEAHANGFRYLNPRHPNEPVHVMFRNIKHAFFQPAENEMITILHFHLVNPIMLGNKKTKDVQFYAEVMDVVQTLDGGRRNMYDPDEIEEEQRERERRNKINAEFQSFVKRVQELWEKDFPDLHLEFDIPFRELGFPGVPHRSTAFIMPTVNCLVELVEVPFTVVSLNDIEVINLERVGFNLKNFDMAIVFKDFARDVLRIDAIPSKSLDTIKDWLNSVGIKYYESKLNLAWKPILKSIQEDPDGFIEQGGWEFLNMDKSDDEDGEESEQSEDYAPDEDEDEDDGSEEEEDSDDESLVESDEDDDDDDEDDEDEEEAGKTWEELEEEAKRDDKEREREGDSDDERTRKRKGGPGGGAPPKRRK